MQAVDLEEYFDPTKHGFDSSDFTTDGMLPTQVNEFHGNLGCSYSSPNTFEVDSQRLDEFPYTLTHDGEKITSCQCLWYVNQVAPAIEQGLPVRKYCAHWVRGSLVFIRQQMRLAFKQVGPQTSEPPKHATSPNIGEDVRGNLNYTPFNLMR